MERTVILVSTGLAEFHRKLIACIQCFGAELFVVGGRGVRVIIAVDPGDLVPTLTVKLAGWKAKF